MRRGATNRVSEEAQRQHFSFVFECDAEKKYPDDSLFSFGWMFVCLKVKGLWNVVWRAAGPLGVEVHFWAQKAFQGDIRVASSEN